MYATSCNNNLVSLYHTCDHHNQSVVMSDNSRPDRKISSEIRKPKKDSQPHKNGTKKIKTVEIRKEEVLAIRSRFPNKIPVIVQRYAKERSLPHLEKCKFLVPQEITVAQFQTIIRNRMKLGPNQALYLLVSNRSMVSFSLSMCEVYKEYAANDGFLYIIYASQEVFGNDQRPTKTDRLASDNRREQNIGDGDSAEEPVCHVRITRMPISNSVDFIIKR